MMKFSSLFLMLVSLIGTVNIADCDQQKPKARSERQSDRAAAAPTSTPGTKDRTGTMDGEIKQLAAGSHCSVFESFVFVARDPQTYKALASLNIKLPEPATSGNTNLQDADFFKTHAVIAVFLGQRRTGGYGVDITQGADGAVRIAEQKPKGMVVQVLTTPFKIVAIPVKSDEAVALSLDATWTERWRSYRVTSGELTITGGFAGVHEKLALAGSLQVMRASATQQLPNGGSSSPNKDSLTTLMFELQSNGKRVKQLRDVVSGTVTESGQVNVAYLDSHALSGAIQSPFKATGEFTNDEQEFSLNLETVPSPNISDNFTARASLRATATTSRPPNRAITGGQ